MITYRDTAIQIFSGMKGQQLSFSNVAEKFGMAQ